jgi:GT2 family glycosyltransferase
MIQDEDRAADNSGQALPGMAKPTARGLEVRPFVPDRESDVAAAVADIDVGVIYTHEDDFMHRLMPSLAASASSARSRLILVDNQSAEGTDVWQRAFPRTLVIRNSRRLGYGPNLNRILQESTARYVLLLNTDMYFDPAERMLDKMVQFMDRHADCGLAGCRLYHADNSYAYPARRFLTPQAIAARRVAPLRLLLGQHENDLLYKERDADGVFECDWLSGCFLCVRREAWLQVGGFDERFEKYFEDVDYCARIAAAGWRVMFNGQTYGYHIEQRDSRRLLSRDGWLMLKSYYRWLQKWGWNPTRRIDSLRDEVRDAA